MKPTTADCYVCARTTDKVVATGNATFPMCVPCARWIFPTLVEMPPRAKQEGGE